MSRKRKFHNKQGATGLEAAPSPKSTSRPHESFTSNGRARAKVLFWAVAASFVYGVINNQILSRPEETVDSEMLAVCALTIILQIVMYYVGAKYFETSRTLVSGLWWRISRFEHWKYSPALATFLLAISLASMMFIGAPNFQAKVVDFRFDRLTKQIRSVEAAYPFQDTAAHPFEQLLSTVETTARYNVPVDTRRVERARNAIADSLSSKHLPESEKRSAWATMAGLGAYADYRSIEQGGLGPRPVRLGKTDPNEAFVLSSHVELKDVPAWFVGTQSNVQIGDVGFILTNAKAIFDDLRFQGEYSGAIPILVKDASSKVLVRNSAFRSVTQDLQGVSWQNVQFSDSIILYSGGPVNLYMVKFQQCNLQFGGDQISQELKMRILSANGQPISFAAGEFK
jgi:hypothetical protein